MRRYARKSLPKFISEPVDPRTLVPGDRLSMSGYGINVIHKIEINEKTFSVTIHQTDGIQVITYAIGNWPEKVTYELTGRDYHPATRIEIKL